MFCGAKEVFPYLLVRRHCYSPFGKESCKMDLRGSSCRLGTCSLLELWVSVSLHTKQQNSGLIKLYLQGFFCICVCTCVYMCVHVCASVHLHVEAGILRNVICLLKMGSQPVRLGWTLSPRICLSFPSSNSGTTSTTCTPYPAFPCFEGQIQVLSHFPMELSLWPPESFDFSRITVVYLII